MSKLLLAGAVAALAAWSPSLAWAQAAQARMDTAYNAQLAAQKLAAPDASYCSQFTGDAFTACKVTRNYLAQINSGAEKKGSYPPQADGSYTKTNDELNKLADRLPGG